VAGKPGEGQERPEKARNLGGSCGAWVYRLCAGLVEAQDAFRRRHSPRGMGAIWGTAE
jgi:hypothetical protein